MSTGTKPERTAIGQRLRGLHDGKMIEVEAVREQGALIYWQSLDRQFDGVLTRPEWEFWHARDGF